MAASCCAHLLTQAGLPVELQPVDRPRLPVILLGEQALALIRDIFGRPDLFAGLPRIRKRVVAWGPNAAPLPIQHSAVVVSEASLLEALHVTLAPPGDPLPEVPWTILAARPLPAPSVEHCFGSRGACAWPVKLRESSDPDACWIESLERGWLFLAPTGPGSGWLLAVGDQPVALLDRSQVIAPEIATCGDATGVFPAYARIASPLCASGWLACGTAAISFDPICGDGTAHAVREAILASAVIRALMKGDSPDRLLEHYEARLTAGFRRHLMLCRQFYASGGTGPLWRSQLEAIDRGIQWSDRKLGAHARFRYQLRGLELEAVG